MALRGRAKAWARPPPRAVMAVTATLGTTISKHPPLSPAHCDVRRPGHGARAGGGSVAEEIARVVLYRCVNMHTAGRPGSGWSVPGRSCAGPWRIGVGAARQRRSCPVAGPASGWGWSACGSARPGWGQCTVESRSGAGTRVLVEVPLPACGGGAWGLRRSHASVRFPHAS
jgi:hypothetical protein